jgi:hypothetical protein
VLEWLSLGVRPLRYGHPHVRSQTFFLRPFFRNLTIHYNSCLKGSYECICYLFLIVLSGDELDIDSIDGFEKGMYELHPNPEGEEPKCYCVDVCKMDVSGDYKTLW